MADQQQCPCCGSPWREKVAPVQGYTPGIPWSIHLEAYDAYRKRWGPQEALIDLEGRYCRGGFGVTELDQFVPGWRERVSEIHHLRAEVARLSASAAASGQAAVQEVQPSAQTDDALEVSTDAIQGLLQEHAKLIEAGNDYAYFELAYTRQTGWMAWLTDRPARGEPGTAEYAKSRKVIARGQGDTAEEACADALAAVAQARKLVKGGAA